MFFALWGLLLLLLPAVCPAQTRKYQQKEPEHLRSVPVNDTTQCLYKADHSFIYLGEAVGAKGKRGPFADGYGLARYVTRDPLSGEARVEYVLCPWKRGSRHGEGLLQRADGTVVRAVWQWDQLKSVSDEAPSAEELEDFKHRIVRMEAMARLLGPAK